MALFSKKDTGKEQSAVPAAAQKSAARGYAHILKRPRVTEKATDLQEGSVYVFDVDTRATKRDISAAVRATYKVVARKIAIITVPQKARRSMRTGARGISSGGKKAYVYLKKGDTITIA